MRSVLFLVAVSTLPAAPVVLYDGSLNSSPTAQSWLYAENISGSVESLSGGAVTLDTRGSPGDTIRAGYGRIAPFALSLNPGVHLRIDAQVNSETHASNDRAGFSLIAISNGALGIELAFWESEIWAQNAAFTHGEGALFDTRTGFVQYDLFLDAAGYRLLANGSPILSGLLRDYPGGFLQPYDVPNSLFFGDDTSSARARFTVSRLEIEAIPEPATLLLCGSALVLIALRQRRA